eukprot:6179145-Pleurochrysis_carterae.AAC.2
MREACASDEARRTPRSAICANARVSTNVRTNTHNVLVRARACALERACERACERAPERACMCARARVWIHADVCVDGSIGLYAIDAL